MAGTPKGIITLKLGEDYERTFFIRIKETQEPVDIQTWQFKAGIKADIDDDAVLDTFTFSAPFLDAEDNTWKVTRSISSTKIAGLGVSEGASDQFFSDDGGTTWFKMKRWSIVVEKKATVLT